MVVQFIYEDEIIYEPANIFVPRISEIVNIEGEQYVVFNIINVFGNPQIIKIILKK